MTKTPESADGISCRDDTISRAIAALEAEKAVLRDLVAKLWCASGCSCCRDDTAWEAASEALGELLDAPKWPDGSDGHNWYAIRDATISRAISPSEGG